MSWAFSCHATALSQKIPLFTVVSELQDHLCQPDFCLCFQERFNFYHLWDPLPELLLMVLIAR